MYYYFLILGLTGLSAQILFYLKINPNIASIAGSHLILFSFHYKYFSKFVNLLHLVLYSAITALVCNYLPFPYLHIYFIIIHFFIIAFILNRALLFIHKYLEVRLFHVILIVYEIGIIGKYLSLVLDLHSGVYYFAITNMFEIFIALFSTTIREDKPRLAIRLTKNKELITARVHSAYFRKWDI